MLVIKLHRLLTTLALLTLAGVSSIGTALSIDDRTQRRVLMSFRRRKTVSILWKEIVLFSSCYMRTLTEKLYQKCPLDWNSLLEKIPTKPYRCCWFHTWFFLKGARSKPLKKIIPRLSNTALPSPDKRIRLPDFTSRRVIANRPLRATF